MCKKSKCFININIYFKLNSGKFKIKFNNILFIK